MDLPHCATCRTRVKIGENVIFREDGRVQHTECPEVLCPVCNRMILPHEPIRRDGELILHGNCWVKRYRSASSPR